MSVSTKTGDTGTTLLYGGERVSKDDIRVFAYGTIDELSSEIGLLITYCASKTDVSFLTQIQRDLFVISGYLATDRKTTELSSSCILQPERVLKLEEQIKELEESLPTLKNFILPGGSRVSAVSHVCRTICRRAERYIVTFHNLEGSEEDAGVMKYINRLSDYFFVLARKLNSDAGIEDVKYGASGK